MRVIESAAMQDVEGRSALIVGTGLAGSLLAVFLARAGWTVRLVERRHDPREKRFAEGRSINLAISARGIKALQRAGLEDRVMKDALRMYCRMIHPVQGASHAHPYSNDPTRGINSVSRSALNLALLDAAASEARVSLLFARRCTHVDSVKGTATFVDEASGNAETFSADLIVGADGAYSAVRDALLKSGRVDFSQTFLTHGYKELVIPPVTSGKYAPHALEPDALHIWPRGASMMIALPNPDGSFTCTLSWPWEDAANTPSFATVRSAADARAVFERDYQDALPLMPTLAEDFERNAAGSMVTVRCSPWTANGRVTLIGDAAHAVVPFYGQGANASFEDCEALTDALAAHANIADALRAYELARKANSNAIADMALANFVEMRDHSAKASFRRKKAYGRFLSRIFGRYLEPEYDLVSFSTVPYTEAQSRGKRTSTFMFASIVLPIMLAGAGLFFYVEREYGKDTATDLALKVLVLVFGIGAIVDVARRISTASARP